MMIGYMEELQAHYMNLLLPPTASVWMDIFHNDDVILKKLGAWSEFPKFIEKDLQHGSYDIKLITLVRRSTQMMQIS